MLRLGNQIRLHKPDLDRIHQLTGVDIDWVRTVEELNDFIDHQISLVGAGTPESRILCMLLVKERLKQKE
jgi:hypothetical protein